MAIPGRTYNQFPVDASISPDSLSDWGNWVTKAVQQLEAPLFPPPTPQVTTISHPNAVQVIWNEVGSGTTNYAVFETSSPILPPGIPFATVPANTGANSNSVLRPNITDTTTRYYSVQAVTPNARSQVSTPTPGTALSGASATIPVSQVPVNQAGVGGGTGGGGGLSGGIGITGKRVTQ